MSGRRAAPGSMRGHPDARAAGFTLLELLVGLVVLGFVMVALSQGVRYGLRVTQAQTRLSQEGSDLEAVDRTLRRLIAAADPGDGHSGPTLQGGAGRLLLVSSLLPGTDQDADIAIGVDPAQRLVLRWTPHRHVQPFGPPPAPQVVVLLPGVARLDVAFYGAGWQPDWTEASLPRLVRLRLVFPPEARRHWPDIVVAPVRARAS